MIYSIIPPEEIWDESNADPTFREVDINGCLMQVEQLTATRGRVVRLLSTDPQDFLNPSYQPGSFLNLND